MNRDFGCHIKHNYVRFFFIELRNFEGLRGIGDIAQVVYNVYWFYNMIDDGYES